MRIRSEICVSTNWTDRDLGTHTRQVPISLPRPLQACSSLSSSGLHSRLQFKMSLKPSFRRFGSSSSNKSPPMLPSRSSDATPQLAQPSALDQPGILLAPETWSKTGSGSSSVLLTPTPPLPPSVQSTSTNSGTDLTAQLQNKLAFVDGDKSDRAGASSKMERQPSGSTFVDGTKSPRASAMSSGLPRTWTQSSAGDGRYRRKVGFEAFDTQPEALFAFTCAVSKR